MKSYTDISQSNKLAEILPLESADMCWIQIYDENHMMPDHRIDLMPFRFYSGIGVPCWSLASLLEEIPEVINFDDDESDYALEISKENDLYYLSYGNPFEHDKIEVEPQEYFVDACVAMIEFLHEQKLL